MAVNFSGMCWTMTIPKQVAGNLVSTASSACVPPVEVPMAINCSVVHSGARLLAGASITAAGIFGQLNAVAGGADIVPRIARICQSGCRHWRQKNLCKNLVDRNKAAFSVFEGSGEGLAVEPGAIVIYRADGLLSWSVFSRI